MDSGCACERGSLLTFSTFSCGVTESVDQLVTWCNEANRVTSVIEFCARQRNLAKFIRLKLIGVGERIQNAGSGHFIGHQPTSKGNYLITRVKELDPLTFPTYGCRIELRNYWSN